MTDVGSKELKQSTQKFVELYIPRFENASSPYSTICFHISGLYNSWKMFSLK